MARFDKASSVVPAFAEGDSVEDAEYRSASGTRVCRNMHEDTGASSRHSTGVMCSPTPICAATGRPSISTPSPSPPPTSGRRPRGRKDRVYLDLWESYLERGLSAALAARAGAGNAGLRRALAGRGSRRRLCLDRGRAVHGRGMGRGARRRAAAGGMKAASPTPRPPTTARRSRRLKPWSAAPPLRPAPRLARASRRGAAPISTRRTAARWTLAAADGYQGAHDEHEPSPPRSLTPQFVGIAVALGWRIGHHGNRIGRRQARRDPPRASRPPSATPVASPARSA